MLYHLAYRRHQGSPPVFGKHFQYWLQLRKERLVIASRYHATDQGGMELRNLLFWLGEQFRNVVYPSKFFWRLSIYKFLFNNDLPLH